MRTYLPDSVKTLIDTRESKAPLPLTWISGFRSRHLALLSTLIVDGTGLTGGSRSSIRMSLDKLFWQAEICFLSSTQAEARSNSFLKNVRSSVLMARFIGGRNMSAEGLGRAD